MKPNGKIKSFIRFVITGLLATALHFTIALSLIHFEIASSQVANGIAFFTTSTISYFINTLWSFSHSVNRTNAYRYFSVSIVGFFLSYLAASISSEYTMNQVVIILSVAFTVPPVIYLLHHNITYNKKG